MPPLALAIMDNRLGFWWSTTNQRKQALCCRLGHLAAEPAAGSNPNGMPKLASVKACCLPHMMQVRRFSCNAGPLGSSATYASKSFERNGKFTMDTRSSHLDTTHGPTNSRALALTTLVLVLVMTVLHKVGHAAPPPTWVDINQIASAELQLGAGRFQGAIGTQLVFRTPSG